MDKARHNHHYVPRQYLRAWCQNGDGTIAVRIGGRLAQTISVDRIGFEDRGYSYEVLTPEMLRSVLCCKPRSRLVTDSMMREFFFPTVVIPVFYQWLDHPANNDVIEMWRMVQKSNLIAEADKPELERLRRVYYSDQKQFATAMRNHLIEGYEGVLCNIENNAWPILNSMLRGKCGWVKNDTLAFRMFYYIFTQRTRSPGFKKMMAKTYTSENVSADFARGGLYRRHILALDSAAIMMQMRPRLAFRILTVKDDSEFITGDLPVINIRSDKSKDYYFPISPKRAFLFGPRGCFDKRNARLLKGDRDSAMSLNHFIFNNSALQIYGSSQQVLNEVATYNSEAPIHLLH